MRSACERRRGISMQRQEPRGALHGLPVTIKSSIATAGYRCEIGSLLHKDEIPAEDAVVVGRLRAAGALILGTTNCPEFLMAYESANLLHGRSAQSMGPGAFAGRIERRRIGGHCGGAFGRRAGQRQRRLGAGAGALYGHLLAEADAGTNSRPRTSAAVRGAVLDSGGYRALGAHHGRRSVALSRRLPARTRAIPSARRWRCSKPSLDELRACKVGYFEDDGLVPVTDETRSAVRAAAQALRETGFRVEPFRPRALEQLRKIWWTFFVQCGAMFYEPEIRGRRDRLSPIFAEFLSIAEAAGPLTATELLDAWAELDLLRSRVLAEMKEFPVLLCPVASIPAFRHDERTWSVEGQSVSYLDAVRYTQWFNALAAPAAVVPVGKSPEGLPIGVQVVARPFQDETALAVAACVDAAFGYQSAPDCADLIHFMPQLSGGVPAKVHSRYYAPISTFRLMRRNCGRRYTDASPEWSAQGACKLARTLCRDT
jgi:amidase